MDIGQTPSNEGGKITLFHVFVVCLSLSLTIGVWQYTRFQEDRRVGLRFEAARDQALAIISDRMTKYEDGLWAGVAAVESHGGDISYQDWHVFAEHLRIDTRYPGINGIGVIHFESDATLPDYLANQRIDRPEFRVFPEHANGEYMPITFIEPERINAAAVGLDVAHETNRRTAAMASRDTGTAQITGPIVLVQDAGKTPGFLFYAPFYEGGLPEGVEARRDAALGLVYAPFVVHKLMEGLLARELRNIKFSISDGGELIYDEHADEDPLIDPDPMFSEKVALELYGRTWTLDMRTDLAFRADNTSSKPTIILLAGLMIEMLIIALLFLMARANRRATEYADRVTVALREEKERLVSANGDLSSMNEELERFAYVASHDLRTPIRGINGLTEMIQEDLEDYLTSKNANPEVAVNLDRIRSRVRRMENLTKDIMQYSSISTSDQAETLRMDELVTGLAFDFNVSQHQIVQVGGSEEVCVDQTNFQSVVGNLVGNAIKYHDAPDRMRIEVRVETVGDRLHVSVSDNGPGIDPKFHAKVFEVFQTLGADSNSDSTGIGLAIVRKAVERHGGKVSLVSSLNEGATFSFDWPNVAEPRADEPIGKAA